ncbi:MAG TPA: S1 RNA-binding domain-containing protein [Polyangia bacterium]|nr:S1 RNA-binding domain-containing protein [Polyangia bacterium]
MPPEHEEEDFATLLAEFEGPDDGRSKKKRKEPQVGDQVRGKVISIGKSAAFVDIGAKSDGVIDLTELRDADGKLLVKPMDELEARVVEVGGPSGSIVLKRLLGRGAEGKAELEQAFQLGVPVEGTVSGVNKGGVEVTVAGVRAFCPISQLDSRHVEDAAAFVGQKLRFRITRYELNGNRLNMIVSRRALLDEEQAKLAVETRKTLEPGAVVRGKVTTIKDYGAFVDLGGVEGMLHVSELGFQRVGHPKDVLSVGQEIEVQILKMEKGDDPKRGERISLSLKSLASDPWADAATKFYEGARASGKVVRLETFGAFVELAPGVEGLLHVSELAKGKQIRHAREATQVGAQLAVVVLAVDKDKRRLSLGLVEAGDESNGSTNDAPQAPSSLGTFADLLKGGKKTK